MRWKDDEKKMEIEQNLIEQDMTMADDVRSMKEIIKMANSICPILQFTGDCPGANTSNKLPISSWIFMAAILDFRTLSKRCQNLFFRFKFVEWLH